MYNGLSARLAFVARTAAIFNSSYLEASLGQLQIGVSCIFLTPGKPHSLWQLMIRYGPEDPASNKKVEIPTEEWVLCSELSRERGVNNWAKTGQI